MNPTEFVKAFTAWADWCSKKTGVEPLVILAQWADETGWATSEHWLVDHNPAGISPGGVVAHYDTVEVGMTAYVSTLNLEIYNPVRAASGVIDQALALGASPWAAGHYEDAGKGPGSGLVAILVDSLGVKSTPTPPEPVTPPSAPVPTSTWDEQAAAHWEYTEATGKILTAWYAVMDAHPTTTAEWHQIATWAFQVSEKKATLGGVLALISQLPGAQFRVNLA
jgi:hypothetical protein